jgi:hypothetical protein
MHNLPEGAERYFDKALGVDPLNIGFQTHLMRAKFLNSKFSEAAALHKKSLELENNMIIALYALYITYLEKDSATFKKEVDVFKHDFTDPSNHKYLDGMLAAKEGNRRMAVQMIKGSTMERLLVFRELDLKQEAIELLKSIPDVAILRGFSDRGIISYPVLKTHKMYDYLQKDPAFQAFLEKRRILYEDKSARSVVRESK